jgi:hypothetical protein
MAVTVADAEAAIADKDAKDKLEAEVAAEMKKEEKKKEEKEKREKKGREKERKRLAKLGGVSQSIFQEELEEEQEGGDGGGGVHGSYDRAGGGGGGGGKVATTAYPREELITLLNGGTNLPSEQELAGERMSDLLHSCCTH